MTVDMRLGLFAISTDDSSSVPGCHADDYQPTIINIAPHNLWTRVCLSMIIIIIIIIVIVIIIILIIAHTVAWA